MTETTCSDAPNRAAGFSLRDPSLDRNAARVSERSRGLKPAAQNVLTHHRAWARHRIRLYASYLVVALAVLASLTGCVRRTISITTEPPHALVYLNDQEIGRSAVTTDFIWYGDYDVIIRKDGYKTLKTHWNIKPPWYQVVPVDFFAEVLWPGHIHDVHTRHFVLEPAEPPTQDELIERATETRQQALDARQP
jgi:hypothetical protein